MTLHVLRQDEAVVVSRGGRLRVVAPWPSSTHVNNKIHDDPGVPTDSSSTPSSGVHGYALRYELPSLSPSSSSSSVVEEPVLLCRGLVEGTSWEAIHRDLIASCSAAGDDGGGGGEGGGGGDGGGEGVRDVVSYLTRHPEHGGAFWLLVRDARGACFARTDTLGREPLLTRRVLKGASEAEEDIAGGGEGRERVCDGDANNNNNDVECEWVLASAPGGAWWGLYKLNPADP
jgi:hypothetical protein